MNYEVENPKIKQLLKDIGVTILNALPEEWGFTIMIFSYGEGGSLFYLSSAHREDMIKALDEFKAKLISERR